MRESVEKIDDLLGLPFLYPAEDLVNIGMLCHMTVVCHFFFKILSELKFRLVIIAFILGKHY